MPSLPFCPIYVEIVCPVNVSQEGDINEIGTYKPFCRNIRQQKDYYIYSLRKVWSAPKGIIFFINLQNTNKNGNYQIVGFFLQDRMAAVNAHFQQFYTSRCRKKAEKSHFLLQLFFSELSECSS